MNTRCLFALLLLVFSLHAHSWVAVPPGSVDEIAQKAYDDLDYARIKALVASGKKFSNMEAAYEQLRTAVKYDEGGHWVTAFLKMGAPVDQAGSTLESPLIVAAMARQPRPVEILIAAGADVNRHDSQGFTALHWVANYSGGRHSIDLRGQIAEMLLNAKASINAKSNHGITPLGMAVLSGEDLMTRTLLHEGANRKLVPPGFGNMLEVALKFEGDTAGAVPALLAAGEDPLEVPEGGQSALHAAVQLSRREMVQAMLPSAAGLRSTDSKGFTPLGKAAYQLDHNMVQLLLSHGANPSLGQGARSPLALAMEPMPVDVPLGLYKSDMRDKVEELTLLTVQALLAKKADPDAKLSSGRTALDHAAAKVSPSARQVELIGALVSAGATVTPEILERALRRKVPELTAVMMSRGRPESPERIAKRSEIIAAVTQNVEWSAFGYRCSDEVGKLPGGLPLDASVSAAERVLAQTHSVAESFKSCVAAFAAMAQPSKQEVLPVYHLLLPEERRLYEASYERAAGDIINSMGSKRDLIDFVVSRAIENRDQARYDAADARRAEAERQQWLNSVAASFAAVQRSLQPPPKIDPNEFAARIANQKGSRSSVGEPNGGSSAGSGSSSSSSSSSVPRTILCFKGTVPPPGYHCGTNKGSDAPDKGMSR